MICRLLTVDPSNRISLKDIRYHPWLTNTNERPIFSEQEKDSIMTQYLDVKADEFRELFVDSDLPSAQRNDSARSNVLAPYNSLQNTQSNSSIAPQDDLLKFLPYAKDYDVQYEKNNNCEVDNGIYNRLMCDSSSISSLVPIEEEPISEKPGWTSVIGNDYSINNSIVQQVMSYGYTKEYILDSLKKKEINHATASYYILLLAY